MCEAMYRVRYRYGTRLVHVPKMVRVLYVYRTWYVYVKGSVMHAKREARRRMVSPREARTRSTCRKGWKMIVGTLAKRVYVFGALYEQVPVWYAIGTRALGAVLLRANEPGSAPMVPESVCAVWEHLFLCLSDGCDQGRGMHRIHRLRIGLQGRNSDESRWNSVPAVIRRDSFSADLP